MSHIENSRQLLTQLVQLLEDRIRETGLCNIMCLHTSQDAAVLIGDRGLVKRFRRIIRACPDELVYFGIQDEPWWRRLLIRRRWNHIPSVREVEAKYRLLDIESLRKLVEHDATSSAAMALCLEGRHAEARNTAALQKDDYYLGEVGHAQAVLGDLDSALDTANDSRLSSGRGAEIRFIVLIEAARRGDRRFSSMLAAYSERELDEWSLVHLAIGLTGRAPWGIYPWSDC